MAETMTQQALTIDEVAERLQITRKTVSRLIEQGLLAAFKVGREYRIWPSDLDDYVRRTRVRDTGPANSH